MSNAVLFNPKSEMHRLVQTVATCMLMFHMIGGCCWHHDHADCSGCGEETVCGPLTGDRVDVSDVERDTHTCQNGCDEDECDFVLPGSRSVVKKVRVSLSVAVLTVPAIVVPSAVSPRHSLEGHLAGSSSPLRLHLLNQSLLI
jgi:hypothetical protein